MKEREEEKGSHRDVGDCCELAGKAITRNAETRILVLDSSKFSRKAHACSGHITDVEHVVCNARPPEPICALLEQAGVNLVICEETTS